MSIRTVAKAKKEVSSLLPSLGGLSVQSGAIPADLPEVRSFEAASLPYIVPIEAYKRKRLSSLTEDTTLLVENDDAKTAKNVMNKWANDEIEEGNKEWAHYYPWYIFPAYWDRRTWTGFYPAGGNDGYYSPVDEYGKEVLVHWQTEDWQVKNPSNPKHGTLMEAHRDFGQRIKIGDDEMVYFINEVDSMNKTSKEDLHKRGFALAQKAKGSVNRNKLELPPGWLAFREMQSPKNMVEYLKIHGTLKGYRGANS